MIEKAMVMAAGVGSRLDPLTKNLPKPLVPVLNMPVMDILLYKLSACGVKDVIANTYYLSEQIHSRYEKNCPVNIKFECEAQLSGTAGGVKKCEYFFKEEDNFLVVSADGFHDADIEKIIESHEKSGCIATMAIVSVPMEEVSNYGVVVFSEDNKVLGFQEKPPVEEAQSNFVNTGIYVFSSRIFDFIPANTAYDFAKNVFPALLDANENINVYKMDNYWSDIGTIAQYIQSNKDALCERVGVPFAKIINGSDSVHVIGEGTVLPDSAQLSEFCVIGKNCRIGRNTTLKNVILWDNVRIADNVTIENTVVANNTSVETDLKDKIVGSDMNIEKYSEKLITQTV